MVQQHIRPTIKTGKGSTGISRIGEFPPSLLEISRDGIFLSTNCPHTFGSSEKRFGFTARDILKPEEGGITPADVAAALTQGIIDAQQSQAHPEGTIL